MRKAFDLHRVKNENDDSPSSPLMNMGDENISFSKTFKNSYFEDEGRFVGFLFFLKQRKVVNGMTEKVVIWDFDTEEILQKRKIVEEDGVSINELKKYSESEYLVLCEGNVGDHEDLKKGSSIFKCSVDDIDEHPVTIFYSESVIHKILPLTESKPDMILCVGEKNVFIISVSHKSVFKKVKNHGVTFNRLRHTEVLLSRNHSNSVYFSNVSPEPNSTVRLLDLKNEDRRRGSSGRDFDGHIIQKLERSQNFSQLCIYHNSLNEEILLGVSEWFHPDIDPGKRKKYRAMDMNRYKLLTIFVYNTSKSRSDPDWMKKFNVPRLYDKVCASVFFNRFLLIGEIERSLSCHDIQDVENVTSVFRNESVRRVKKVEQIIVSPGKVFLMKSKPYSSQIKILEVKSEVVKEEAAKSEEMKRVFFLRNQFGWEKENYYTYGYFLLFRLENKSIESILKLLFFLEI